MASLPLGDAVTELTLLRACRAMKSSRAGDRLRAAPAPLFPKALRDGIMCIALAWVLFNGLSASPWGFSFQLAVTLQLAAIGIGWALAMGLVGGLLPALRAARIPVTEALRAT